MDTVKQLYKNNTNIWSLTIPKNFALIVVNTYSGTKQDLKNAPYNNALLCKQKLEELGYETNIMLDPTCLEFISLLALASSSIKGKFVLYYYGHGRKQGLKMKNGLVAKEEITKRIKKYRSMLETIIIADTCHSENLFNDVEAIATIVTSSGTDEKSSNIFKDRKEYGLMTYYFWNINQTGMFEKTMSIVLKKFNQTFILKGKPLDLKIKR